MPQRMEKTTQSATRSSLRPSRRSQATLAEPRAHNADAATSVVGALSAGDQPHVVPVSAGALTRSLSGRSNVDGVKQGEKLRGR